MEDSFFYFLNGFVLLNLGLMLTLEIGRTPPLAPRRMLGALVVFAGFLGLHDWLDIFLGQGICDIAGMPVRFLWLDEVSLAIGSAALIAAGLHVFRLSDRWSRIDVAVGFAMFVLWLVLVLFTGMTANPDSTLWIIGAEMRARCLLTFPGALLTAFAFRKLAVKPREENRGAMAAALSWTATGFILYSIFQLFLALAMGFSGSPFIDMLESQAFPGYLLLPALNVAVATLVFAALFRAVFVGEQERQQRFAAVEGGYIKAMEQVAQELQKRKEQRQKLMRHILIAQEDERARIARELHDETAQTITAAALNLASLENVIPKNPEVCTLVGRLQDLCHDMSRGLYRLVHDLRPAQLDDLGLVPALRHLVDESRRHSSIDVSFKVEGQQHRLDPLTETVFFRIAQEALTNVAKHAEIAEAEIRLKYEPEQAILQVSDRGVGFDPEELQTSQTGWGVAGMQERAEAAGGKLRIVSQPGEGTMVEISVPLEEAGDENEKSETREITEG